MNPDAESAHGALKRLTRATDVQGLSVKVAPSVEIACVRCFRRTGTVGRSTAHEHLCTRCAEVVGEEA